MTIEDEKTLEKAGGQDDRWLFAGFAALVALAFAGYMGVVFSDYITLDDPQYVYANPMVQKGLTGETIVWAFTSVTVSNWHPVTMLSHLLDVTLFGVEYPGGHHATGLMLHIVNACLLFWVLLKATGMRGRAWVVAGLFAVHPIHVESVAWISSRKDVLSLMFVLLTMLTYMMWVESGRRMKGFWLVLGGCALALMSKPTAVTLPAVLLLMDFWPLKRLTKWGDLKELVVEKLPLMALCAAAAICTFIVQRTSNAMAGMDVMPMDARLANVPVSYARYLTKLAWPADLAVLYPHPVYWGAGAVAMAAVIVAAITIWAIYWGIKRDKRYVLVGWLWFLGVLVPMIGVVQVGSQSMADRYAYISFIGLYILVVWAVAEKLDGMRVTTRMRAVICAVVLVGLTLTTRTQVGYWTTPRALYAHGLTVTKGNFFLLNNLGEVCLSEGKPEEARGYLQEALKIHPGLAAGHENLGLALFQLGDYAGAAKEYRQAIELGSKRTATQLNLGWALVEGGRPQQALEVFKALDATDGAKPETQTGIGVALGRLNREKEAQAVFEGVLKEWPWYMAVRYHYAQMLLYWPGAKGDPMAAVNMLMPALKSEPGNTPVVLLMAEALWELNNEKNAMTLLEAALKDAPNDKRLQDAVRNGRAGGARNPYSSRPDERPTSTLPPITIPEYTKNY